MQVTVTGVPPPRGVATVVYGPVTPEVVGDAILLIDVGLVTVTTSAGDPPAGVVITTAGEGGAGLPVAGSVPETDIE